MLARQKHHTTAYTLASFSQCIVLSFFHFTSQCNCMHFFSVFIFSYFPCSLINSSPTFSKWDALSVRQQRSKLRAFCFFHCCYVMSPLRNITDGHPSEMTDSRHNIGWLCYIIKVQLAKRSNGVIFIVNTSVSLLRVLFYLKNKNTIRCLLISQKTLLSHGHWSNRCPHGRYFFV